MLREKSCGIVPYREVQGEIRYLVISSAVTKREHWEFPKGGVELGEREIDTALRELWEETGVKDVRVLPGYREPIRYIYRRPEGLVSKQVVYFIARVGDPTVKLREVEAKDYRWADYDEARKLLRHANARALLERCHAFITGKPVPGAGQRKAIQPRQPPGKRPAERARGGEPGGERRAQEASAAVAAPESPEVQVPAAATLPGQVVAVPSQPQPAGDKPERGAGGRRRRRRGKGKARSQREARGEAARGPQAEARGQEARGPQAEARGQDSRGSHGEAKAQDTRMPQAEANGSRGQGSGGAAASAPGPTKASLQAEPATGREPRRRKRRRGRRGGPRQASAPEGSAPPEPSAHPGSRSNA